MKGGGGGGGGAQRKVFILIVDSQCTKIYLPKNGSSSSLVNHY